MKLLVTLSLLIASLGATAGKLTLSECKDVPGVSVENVFGVRSFHDGQVMLMDVDTVEPAAGAHNLVITYYKPESAEGYAPRGCSVVTFLAGIGDLAKIKATYSARTGITALVPVRRMNADGNFVSKVITLNIRTINAGRENEGQVVSAIEN